MSAIIDAAADDDIATISLRIKALPLVAIISFPLLRRRHRQAHARYLRHVKAAGIIRR